MSEIKGTVEMVSKGHTSSGKDVWTVMVNGTKYQCWSELKEGQVLPEGATVKPPKEGTTFPPTIFIPRAGGFKGGGGRPFSPDQQKTMIMSYAKDLTITMLEKGEVKHTVNAVADACIALYNKLYDAIHGSEKSEVPF